MDRKQELRESLRHTKGKPKKGKYVGKGKLRTKLNWGFWLLMIGFAALLVTWFIVKPMLEG